jgi:hypothetical protein
MMIAIPMTAKPDFLISVCMFLCERILLEQDQVPSAIRIFDVYYVPDMPPGAPPDAIPLIQPWVFVSLKAVIGHGGKHAVRLRLINTIGEESTLAEETATFTSRPGMEAAPPTIVLRAGLNLGAGRFGVCYICLDVNGVEVARTPLTVMRKLSETRGDGSKS